MKILDESIEKRLVFCLVQGDESAFSELYKVYSKPLYLKVLRMVKDKDTSDELIQELFIRIWNNRKRLDPEKSFQAYMYTAVQNLVHNYFRKLASQNALIQNLLLQSADNYFDGEQALEDKEAYQLIEKAIEQLTPQRKRVFILCKMQGKSYEETSKIMGISLATVNSHMTQSLQIIKAYIF